MLLLCSSNPPLMASTPSSSPRPAYAPNRIADTSYIRVFDTTLRDGEQAPGAAMTADQKLAVARLLARLGVDVMEAGFPSSSPMELEAVRAIAKEVGNLPAYDNEGGHVPVICAAARCNRGDVEAAWEAVRHARWPRVVTFISTSEIHMQHKLNKSRDEVVALARDGVAYLRSLGCNDIGFAAEDACRSDREFLYHVLEEVINAGATTITIPDTVGYTLPSEYGRLISDIKAKVRGIEKAIISCHCHNDLGLATANTLAGVEGGARQVEVTINGIGERAGNAAFEEVVMAMKCRKELLGGLYTGINTRHIVAISKMVAEYTGLHVQPHKAIVGANAFSHESGIHQDGILKFRGTYEIILPEDIGLSQLNGPHIVLGKLSGRHALRSQLLKLGYDIDGQELNDIFRRFKEVAQKRKHVSDAEIEALVHNENFQSQVTWLLGDLQVMHGTIGFPAATVRLISSDGEEKIACSVGEGPVDAAYKAINSIVKVPIKLVEHLNSGMEGINAIASTEVVICEDNTNESMHASNGETYHRTYSGNGTGIDTVISSVQAYLGALNLMLSFKHLSDTRSSTKTFEISK